MGRLGAVGKGGGWCLVHLVRVLSLVVTVPARCLWGALTGMVLSRVGVTLPGAWRLWG